MEGTDEVVHGSMEQFRGGAVATESYLLLWTSMAQYSKQSCNRYFMLVSWAEWLTSEKLYGFAWFGMLGLSVGLFVFASLLNKHYYV